MSLAAEGKRKSRSRMEALDDKPCMLEASYQPRDATNEKASGLPIIVVLPTSELSDTSSPRNQSKFVK
jgi:hypothetical protein